MTSTVDTVKEPAGRPACLAVSAMWNTAVAAFLAGGPAVPPPLHAWYSSYSGQGRGRPDLAVFPEPFLGVLDQPRAVFLALNPGKPYPAFQGRNGVFADEIRTSGSYASWAATWPYLREPWISKVGKNRHHSSRLRFMRDWCGEPQLQSSAMVGFELYPWHSPAITATIRPDWDVVEEYVWRPIAELRAPVFAFGAPWLSMLEAAPGLHVVDRLGLSGRDYGSAVPSRTVVVIQAPNGLTIFAEKHAGSASAPSTDETARLRAASERWLRG
jgi:hypothetical protein